MGEVADDYREQEEKDRILLALHKAGKCKMCMFCYYEEEELEDI